MQNRQKIENIELFLLDMDGTLFLGDELFEGAVDFVNKITETGRQFIYLTNNSSKNRNDYIEKLEKMGLPCDKDKLFTSSMATGRYLRKNHKNEKVYAVGTKKFVAELENYGVNLSTDEPTVVAVAFDTELDYEKLNLATRFLRRGATFIAANPDTVCPLPRGEVMPDCGAICALLTAATGKIPHYIGKPNRDMVDIISDMTGIDNSKIAMVGDRLYTDVALANGAEAASICVLSGECTMEDIEFGDIKPHYIFNSVRELALEL